jgi:hypothetical protein
VFLEVRKKVGGVLKISSQEICLFRSIIKPRLETSSTTTKQHLLHFDKGFCLGYLVKTIKYSQSPCNHQNGSSEIQECRWTGEQVRAPQYSHSLRMLTIRSLMNDRFGKGKGNDRKKVTSAGIQRVNHATGETVCAIFEPVSQKLIFQSMLRATERKPAG